MQTAIVTSEQLLRELQPRRDEIRVLREQIADAARQRGELGSEYERADDPQELWRIRGEQNALETRVERLEKTISAKQSEIAPLEREFHAQRLRERDERDAEELALFLEAGEKELRSSYEALQQAQQAYQDARVRLWNGKPGMSAAGISKCRDLLQRIDREIVQKEANS
jgi:hypothetical protein